MGSPLSTNAGDASLAGQVAIVTGGGRGIGRSIALALASTGATVAVLARSASELAETVGLIEKAGGRVRAFPADVTDAIAIRSSLEKIESALGPTDILVNNAATVRPLGPFHEADIEEWWRTMEINLRGPVLCTHSVLAGMASRHRGRIINIITSAVPLPYLSAYVTSKTALLRFTETLAPEVAAEGVSLFAVAPGTVRTAMSEYSLQSPEGQKWIPWFRRIFDEGLNVPAEQPANLVVKLACGGFDVLSGKLLAVSDDLELLLENVNLIQENNLYSLRVQKLQQNPALAAIQRQGEKAAISSLRIERTLDAPPEKVFQAWIDPNAVKSWFAHAAPVHWKSSPAIDAKPGGRFHWTVISNDNPGDVFEFRGTYREVESPKKLAFTWEWESLPIEGVELPEKTLVCVEFFGQGRATRVVLTHSDFPTKAARDAHDKGWRRGFDGIAQFLAASQSTKNKSSQDAARPAVQR